MASWRASIRVRLDQWYKWILQTIDLEKDSTNPWIQSTQSQYKGYEKTWRGLDNGRFLYGVGKWLQSIQPIRKYFYSNCIRKPPVIPNEAVQVRSVNAFQNWLSEQEVLGSAPAGSVGEPSGEWKSIWICYAFRLLFHTVSFLLRAFGRRFSCPFFFEPVRNNHRNL